MVDVGSVHTRGFLFKLRNEGVYLAQAQTFLTTLSSSQMVEVVEKKIAPPAARVLAVTQPKAALGRALGAFTAEGAAVGIELGAAAMRLGVASLGQTAKVEELPTGLGSGLPGWWEKARFEQVTRWLNGREYPNASSILNYLGMKSLYPAILPPSWWEVGIELAAAREILRQAHLSRQLSLAMPTALAKLHFPKLILSGAVFAHNPRPEVLLAVLDGLQLRGVWQVWLDQAGILPAIGELPRWPKPFSAEEFGFLGLGTVVMLEHGLAPGRSLGSLVLDLGLDQGQTLELQAGELVRVPLEAGQSGQLSLQLASGVKISGSLAGHLVGGELGIVIDARAQPVDEFNVHWLEALK